MRRIICLLVTFTLTVGLMQSAFAADIYITSARVNFRTEASLDSLVIKTLSSGSAVEVLEYDPENWSRVSVNGTNGYIKSEFLVEPEESKEPEEVKQESNEAVNYRTTANVNFRNAPSLDADKIKLLNAGTVVKVLEYDPENWSKISVNDAVGYVKSEYLLNADGYVNGSVELLEWSVVKNMFKLNTPTQVVDVRTGISYNVQSFSNGQHADVEPLTKEDTDVLKKTYGGKWSWDPRPVWVIINGRTIAGSINGMPHGGGTISSNGMDGQVCLHFLGSNTHNGNKSFEDKHQAGVIEAWNH